MYLSINDKKINVIMCNTFLKRLKGFMFKKNINYCLCFPKTNSIHTFFMKENIDVIMADKNNKVLFIYKNLVKNKVILPKKNVYYTYELPNNFIEGLKINDCIKIEN